jgi:luciferase family oxidoreductase group 1
MAQRVSVLDLSPVAAGESEADALRHTLDLAPLCDRLGYHRYWLAEHHGGAMVASSSPEVLIGHVAQVTGGIRVGSGGIMLPNHSPLKVAEQFKVLEALHPGRIDLGIGRAPGTDPLTAYALRRSREAMEADDFPEQMAELLAFAGLRPWPERHPFSHVRAAPVDAPLPPIFLLGSSDFSARMAAANGFGFAFAAQINPAIAVPALRLYRDEFKPSPELKGPYSVLSHAVLCADDEEAGRRLAAPARLAFRRLRMGVPGPIPTVDEALRELGEEALTSRSDRVIVGTGAQVRDALEEMREAGRADEVMVLTTVHDHADRRRSYELLADAYGLPPRTPLP